MLHSNINIGLKCKPPVLDVWDNPIVLTLQKRKLCEIKAKEHSKRQRGKERVYRILPFVYLVNHFHPFGQVFKGLLLCDVIHQHYSLGASVVGWCDAVEPLLTSGVPGWHERRATSSQVSKASLRLPIRWLTDSNKRYFSPIKDDN